jgi:hypothetical protein
MVVKKVRAVVVFQSSSVKRESQGNVSRLCSGFRFVLRQKRVPRFAGLHGLMPLRQLRRAHRDGDKMIARGALNLFPGELFFSLQVLLAVRTGELEFAHNLKAVVFNANNRSRPRLLQQYMLNATSKRIVGLVKND